MGKKLKSSGTTAPSGTSSVGRAAGTHRWTFLSNHALVALSIMQNPHILLREAAKKVGITERAVQRIVADLESDGYLTRTRHGRSNRYELHLNRPLRHPQIAKISLGALLRLLASIAEPAGNSGLRAAKSDDKLQGAARRKGATQR